MDCSSNTETLESLRRIEIFLQSPPLDDTNTLQYVEQLKVLRNLCAVDPAHQNAIAEHEQFNEQLHRLLFDSSITPRPPQNLQLMALQLLANAIVQNPNSQRNIWKRHGAAIVECVSVVPLGRHTNILLMIVYNVLRGAAVANMEQQALCAAVRVWQTIVDERSEDNYEFLHFLFEHFIVHGGHNTVRYYAHLTAAERISFLEYLMHYLRQDSPNGHIHQFLLKYITKEFNIKSDRILVCKPDSAQVPATDPMPAREAYALLRVIASATGSEFYADKYVGEQSLFLNVSSLLRCLAQVGKESQNMFTPMNKLEEVALTSNKTREFETELSFELKTLLVRCIANLLYKNPANQGYCIDTQLLPTLLECTNMDARNPLLKEWSILAIRNACYGCPEIQALIANMTNQGAAQNDIIDELNLDMGALRIKPTR
ncbi:ataxin-10 [Zeugodacus cucurbitae]|uniref:ataxin-10 n=1 Tax=Zeugodacus cucurbitae TaxID=28588 RepID=UPI000596A88E|nr:ataxin-10 [Zeugodacus cucurbitae]